jgi:hypothetical protein
MKKILSALVLLTLFGCRSQPIPITRDKSGKLVIVTPAAWRSDIDKYIDLKTSKGFNVSVITVENIEKTGDSSTWGENLHAALVAAKPDYVFLVGDTSVIPTIFKCSDVSSWSTWTSIACIYSDYYLTLSSEGKPLFSLGRLLTNNTQEIDNYYTKLVNYETIYGKPSGAYMLNDRDYTDDNTVIGYADRLRAIGIKTQVETLNSAYHNANNGIVEATYDSVELAVDDTALFMFYLGHGSSWGWGYRWNILWPWLTFNNVKPVPFVYSMACETALSAPNPPWYPYYDSAGNYKNFSAWDSNVSGPIKPSDLGSVSSLQPSDVLSNSIAHTFTSTTTAGAMVYIGETVVTHAEYDLNNNLLTNVSKAYTSGTMNVGDIWLETVSANGIDMHPEFFQMVGDPSTGFAEKNY